MASDSPSSSVAAVAIVILLLAALIGGYMVFGDRVGHRDNDIRIDLPDKKNK
jgi:hypothetical protein